MTKNKTMDFEPTPIKNGKVKDIKNKVSTQYLDQIGTGKIVWHLVKRHKFGLVTIWAILMTVSYIFPPVWSILGSLVY